MINETTGRRRVLLKLSGEAFGGGQLGVNPDVVSQIAKEIAEAVDSVEIAIVVGGGNFFRGAELSQRGMRPRDVLRLPCCNRLEHAPLRCILDAAAIVCGQLSMACSCRIC